MKRQERGERLEYIGRTCVKETGLMKKVALSLKEDRKEIQLLPYEGKMLSTLISVSQAKNIVEIGTLYGYSALWILESLDKKAKLWTVENDINHFKKAGAFLNCHDRKDQVEVIHSKGVDFFKNRNIEEQIDFLFIDADKGNYLKYLELARPFLRKGSVVVGDNTFLFGHVLENMPPKKYSKNTWRQMREFNEVLSGKTGDFRGMVFPTCQGLSVGVFLG